MTTNRVWTLVTVPQAQLKDVPTRESSIPWDTVCGMDSQRAAQLEKQGLEPFYSDYEQLEAGLGTSYGVSRLVELAEDYVFPDGTVGKEGALYMELTKVNLEDFTFTNMLQVI